MGAYVRKVILNGLQTLGISDKIVLSKNTIKKFINDNFNFNTSSINITELKKFSITKKEIDEFWLTPFIQKYINLLYEDKPNILNTIFKYDKEKEIIIINIIIIEILYEIDDE